MNTKSKIRKAVKAASIEELTSMLMRVNLKLDKARGLRFNNQNPYGDAKTKGYNVKMLKYEKACVLNELNYRTNYGK